MDTQAIDEERTASRLLTTPQAAEALGVSKTVVVAMSKTA